MDLPPCNFNRPLNPVIQPAVICTTEVYEKAAFISVAGSSVLTIDGVIPTGRAYVHHIILLERGSIPIQRNGKKGADEDEEDELKLSNKLSELIHTTKTAVIRSFISHSRRFLHIFELRAAQHI